jgi:hypothetical protein
MSVILNALVILVLISLVLDYLPLKVGFKQIVYLLVALWFFGQLTGLINFGG